MGGTLNTANVTTTGNSLNLSGAGWGMNFIIDADNNSSDNYVFNGNGSEIMRLTDAGDLGIGVTPSAKLTVAGSGTGYARIAGIGGDYTGLFLNGNNAQYNVLSSPTDANLYLNRPSANGIYFRANNTDQMILNSSGNLGVGTTNPARRLEVNNAMKFTNGSADANDGVIGTAPFAAGLNVVGINTDGGGRKINWWGSFIQNENPVGNSFIGNNTFTQLAGTGNRPAYVDATGRLVTTAGGSNTPASGYSLMDATLWNAQEGNNSLGGFRLVISGGTLTVSNYNEGNTLINSYTISNVANAKVLYQITNDDNSCSQISRVWVLTATNNGAVQTVNTDMGCSGSDGHKSMVTILFNPL